MDYIVALASGMEISKNNVLDLTPQSKITAIASGVLYKEDIAQKIIFSGGHTKGKDKKSEAELMFDLLKKKFPDIPDTDVVLEENSIDTAENAEEVKKILPQNSNIILLSFSYHLKRARIIFHNFNLNINKIYASDIVLSKQKTKYKNLLNEFTLKIKIQRIIWEIFCLFLVYTIDPKGQMLRLITRRTRGN